ncbi:hypothetical protein Tco_1154699 [Tanacetum coccineum]
MQVGNGRRASLWHDMWSYECPLSRYLTPRDINKEGHNLHECVADLIEDGTWRWPVTWLIKAPNLALIAAPNIDNARQDTMRWCDLNGNLSDFSIRCAWEVLRPQGEITVVILVRDRCPRGKGNLPRLPIRTNIVRLATPSMGIQTGAVTPNRSIHNIRVHSQCK